MESSVSQLGALMHSERQKERWGLAPTAAPEAHCPDSRATQVTCFGWGWGWSGRIWDFTGWCVLWIGGQSLKMTQGF